MCPVGRVSGCPPLDHCLLLRVFGCPIQHVCETCCDTECVTVTLTIPAVSSDALGVRDSPDSSGGENDPASNSPELSAAPKSRIDTSTFTRPKHGAGKRGAILQYNSELYKRQSSPGPRDTPSPHERGMSPCAVPHAEPQQNGNQEENGNEDDSSAPMWHRLADVEDVQVMARMQEESTY